MKRLVVIAALAAAALVSGVGVASGDNGVQLIPIGRTPFPSRGFLVELPRGTLVYRKDVQVRENGLLVGRFSIAPLEAAPQTFATILVLDASETMRGRPFLAA